MTFAFYPDAKAEFFAAINYYESVEPGLGFDFSVEIFSTIQNAMDYPNAWPVLEGEVRRCLVNRFPYGVLYSIEADEIYILAVMHLHRDPDYWKDRR
jgi:toxin ParE1/3/4